MRTKHLTTRAAWMWLPLFVATCLVLGFYNSATTSATTDGGISLCPDGSRMERLLHCP